MYRPTAANHGATCRTDAMTDPNPRVTKSAGNAQQTSVVSTAIMATIVLARSERISSLQSDKATADCNGGTCVRSDPQWRAGGRRRAVEELGGGAPEAGSQLALERIRIRDRDRQRRGNAEARERHLRRRCGRSRVAPLLVRRAARVRARLILAMLMMRALAARSSLGCGALPSAARNRSGKRRHQQQHQESCERLHVLMMR